ncbi:MAG: hypothetical protein LBM67_02935 [Lentimicrobiaceae bacterium]|nr:hypothetical protein [Lentimicrobiaceae bacterium]
MIFLFLPFWSSSQQVIPTSTQLKLDYKHVNGQSGRNKQFVFFTVSNTTVNDQSYANIAIDVQFRGRVADTNIFAISLHEAKVTTPVLYRKFDVTEHLIPDLFSFEVECLIGNGKSRIYFENVSITDTKEMYFSYDSDRLQIHDLSVNSFNYSDSLTAIFERVVRKINDFHASKRLFEYLIRQHKQLAEDNLLALFNYWDISRKALKETAHFETSFLENNLHEKKTFETLRDQLTRFNTRYKTLLNSELEKKERKISNSQQFIEAYFAYSAQLKADANKLELRDSEIFNQVAAIEIDDDFRAVLRRITASQSLLFLENDLFAAIFNKARVQVNQSNYSEAIKLFETLHQFDLLKNDSAKIAAVKQQQEICKSGLLSDYFRIASRAVTNGNQLLATQYIRKTVDFYKNECNGQAQVQRESEPLLAAMQQKGVALLNAKKIQDAIKTLEEGKQLALTFKNTFYNEDFNELLRYAHHEVYWNILADANQHAANGNTETAHVLIESALHYAAQNALYITNSNDALALRSQIQKPLYDEMLQNSLIMAKKGERKRALELLQNANQLSNNYGIETEIDKDSVNLIVAKPLILNILRSSYVKIWSNDLDDAWRIYSEAKQIADEFSLMIDEDVNREFRSFDKKVIERICLNCKLEFDDLMQTIEVKAEQQKLFDLRQAIKRAEEIVSQNQGCNIDTQKLYEFKSRYSSIFEYEARYNAVLNVLYSEGFKACIPHYLALDKEVSSTYKNVHKTLFDFIKEQQNATLTFMALSYFLEEKDELSLRKCMLLLVDQHFFGDDYADILSQLGSFFAQVDLKNNTSIIDYIPDNKDFKNFNKSYRRNFK